MSELRGDTFLDMYLKDDMITIDVYHAVTNNLELTRQFTPSPIAGDFFAQEATAQEEFLQKAT